MYLVNFFFCIIIRYFPYWYDTLLDNQVSWTNDVKKIGMVITTKLFFFMIPYIIRITIYFFIYSQLFGFSLQYKHICINPNIQVQYCICVGLSGTVLTSISTTHDGGLETTIIIYYK